MNRLAIYSTAVAGLLAVLIWAAPAPGTTGRNVKHTHSTPSVVKQVPSLRNSIQYHRSQTWHYEDLVGRRHIPTAYQERKVRSVPFLHWDKGLWKHRHRVAYHYYRVHRTLSYTNDWLIAVRIVQRDWPGSASWLRSCSSGEGGWGGFVMNYQGSGAGGWMQYMSGTFYSHLGNALSKARALHLALPPVQAREWHSPLGQAFAAGWAHNYTDYHGPWDPNIDPKCY